MENLKEVKKYFKQEILEEAKKLQNLAENKMLLTGKYEYPKYTNEQIEILMEGFFDRMKAKFKDKFTYDPNVKAILINIFGGIVRCDRVAQGVVDAYNNMKDIHVPIIVRLQGTNADLAKTIIDDSGLRVKSAIKLEEAAALVKEVLS